MTVLPTTLFMFQDRVVTTILTELRVKAQAKSSDQFLLRIVGAHPPSLPQQVPPSTFEDTK